MRASTLFALTLAILLGLAVTVGLKVSGVFNKPPEPVAVKKPDVTVLVAARNMFAGDLMDPNWVRTRVLRAEELKHYEDYKDTYVAAVPQAVSLRIAKRNLEADRPIFKEDLEEMAKPESVSHRLLPNMRAVTLSLSKDHCAGGLIQVGEWVDVVLTSQVDNGDKTEASSHTAAIAQNLRVITKRNGLWPVFAPLPEGDVQFALEANPYRAALIEFTRTKGQLTLIPVSSSEQKSLEARRTQVMAQHEAGQDVAAALVLLTAQGPERSEEVARVEAMTKGELDVSNADLVRIFNLKTPAPPEQPVTVQQFVGIERAPAAFFNQDGTRADNSEAALSQAAALRGTRYGGKSVAGASQFRFNVPSCPSCDKQKKASAALRPTPARPK